MNYMVTLFTEEIIDGAHNLVGYDGKCSQVHGHSWCIQVWIQGTEDQKDDVGILFDFSNIKKIKDELDHKYLNEVIEQNASAENLTNWVLTKLMNLDTRLQYRVRIYESAVYKESWCQKQTREFNSLLV